MEIKCYAVDCKYNDKKGTCSNNTIQIAKINAYDDNCAECLNYEKDENNSCEQGILHIYFENQEEPNMILGSLFKQIKNIIEKYDGFFNIFILILSILK